MQSVLFCGHPVIYSQKVTFFSLEFEAWFRIGLSTIVYFIMKHSVKDNFKDDAYLLYYFVKYTIVNVLITYKMTYPDDP